MTDAPKTAVWHSAMGNNAASVERPRLSYLDCLRGFAAVAVMWFHYTLGLQEAPGPGDGLIARFFTLDFDTGKVAVVLFFAISGFIVPESLRADVVSPLQRFGISRLFRLYPVYWISVIACVVIGSSAMQVTGKSFAINLTMVQGFLGVRDINGATWTLAIELVFYGLCVLLFVAGKLRSRHWQFGVVVATLAASMGMAVLRHALGHKYPVAIPLALAVMFFGCLWRGYILEGDRVAQRYAALSLACFAVLLPPICLIAYADLGEGQRYIWTYYVGLAMFALYTRFPIYTNDTLVHLGVISYSVYVLHTPVWLLLWKLVGPTWIRATSLNGELFVAVAMVCTLLLSHIAYMRIERPAIAAGRQLIKRFCQPSVQVQA